MLVNRCFLLAPAGYPEVVNSAANTQSERRGGGALKKHEGLLLQTGGSELTAEADPSSFVPLANRVSELIRVMSRVQPDDLSAAEIAALLGILAPADSRVNGRPTARPGLRLVRSCGEQPTSDLA